MEFELRQKSLDETFKELNSSRLGLSNEEAAKRLLEYGPNSLPEPKIPGLISIFLSQFLSPLIYILVAAAAIVLFMGEIVDAIIIFLVLIFNAVMGTIQEGKAQRTLLALKQFVKTSATATREGKIMILTDNEIVPGDVILIQEGEKIPADGMLISSSSLKIDESILTGESSPAMKTAEEVKNTDPQNQKNIVFKGTNAVSGNGLAVVIATGTSTEIGKISKAVASIDTEIPLKKSIKSLSKIIIATVFFIGVALVILGLAQNKPLKEIFATVISLSVSIIPEGLPIVMTLILASGVWRMAKQKVLIKKLQAVEALGRANIIAVDKTGTITKNEMSLENVYINGNFFDIRGKGYEPVGEILLNGELIEPLNHSDIMLAGRVAHFCSNARAIYIEESKTWKVSGDPTEAALDVFAQKIGFKETDTESPKIFDLPFDYSTKYHATIHKTGNRNFLTVVGAPEEILKLCDRIWTKNGTKKLSNIEKESLEFIFSDMSQKGLRVLAFSINTNTENSFRKNTVPKLVFCGFFGMKDPLREEVKDSISMVRQAGMRVVMITGDHKITARAIAKEAGILTEKENVITGEELEKFSDEELLEKFKTCNVFARVNPTHKLRIIEIFRKSGEIVAMTGDGVNDAPSLAAADLGVAMGKIGTEVAKEAADIVLLDDNFSNIISAAEEGRNIYKTIKKVVLYLFSTSVGEVLTISGALIIGFPLPLFPAQIIWLNFVTDGFLDVALAMEPREDKLLNEFARLKKQKIGIIDSFMAKRMIFMGVIIAAGTLFIFSKYLNSSPGKAFTISLVTLAIFQWFNVWNCKSENKSIFSMNPLKNKFLIGATVIIVSLQIFAVYNPFMGRFLKTVPLNATDWIYAALIAFIIIIAEESRKFIFRKINANKSLG
ncbi:MAG: HAD-IC family P-type ATPase [Spirochaetota bacterium]